MRGMARICNRFRSVTRGPEISVWRLVTAEDRRQTTGTRDSGRTHHFRGVTEPFPAFRPVASERESTPRECRVVPGPDEERGTGKQRALREDRDHDADARSACAHHPEPLCLESDVSGFVREDALA